MFFLLPPGAVFAHEGAGGGFGMGYTAGDGVRRCWQSSNGEDWNPMDPGFRMAVDPVMEANKSLANVVVLAIPDDRKSSREPQKPVETSTLSAFPNPFNPMTEIRYILPKAGNVKLAVFDLRGRRIRDLISQWMEAGEQSMAWDGKDQDGQGVASGVYFARLETDRSVETRPLVLLK